MSLVSLLEERSREAPDRVAVVDLCEGGELTWSAWLSEADRRARVLADAGVRSGDRVALLVDRSARYLAWLTACWRLGCTVAPLETTSPPAEVHGLATHADCAATILDPRLADARAAAEEVPGTALVDGREGTVLRRAAGRREPSPEGDALLLYTSGSTGVPKAVRQTHSAIRSSCEGLTERYGLGRHTRIFGVLSLTHSHGIFMHGLSPLVHAGTLVLSPQLTPWNARTLWSTLAEHRADFFSAVPSLWSLIHQMAEGEPPRPMQFFSGSAPLSEDLRAALTARYGIGISNNFGMSETVCWSLYSGPDSPEGSIGRPTRCRVRVDGEVGELLVCGAQVTPGYFRNPEANATSFTEDGFLRTGDLVRMHPDGWVILVGRSKRVIHRAGLPVHPEEIEMVLASLPEVQEAVVVGVDDATYGEVPRAFVVLRPGAAIEVSALHRHLRSRLAPHRCPRTIDLVESLPKTRSGKPDLRALAARGAAG